MFPLKPIATVPTWALQSVTAGTGSLIYGLVLAESESVLYSIGGQASGLSLVLSRITAATGVEQWSLTFTITGFSSCYLQPYSSATTNYLMIGGPMGTQVIRVTLTSTGSVSSTESFQDTARVKTIYAFYAINQNSAALLMQISSQASVGTFNLASNTASYSASLPNVVGGWYVCTLVSATKFYIPI